MESIEYNYSFRNFSGEELTITTDEIIWDEKNPMQIGSFSITYNEDAEEDYMVVLVAAGIGCEDIWQFGPYDITEAEYVYGLIDDNISYFHPDLRSVRSELESIDWDDLKIAVIVCYNEIIKWK